MRGAISLPVMIVILIVIGVIVVIVSYFLLAPLLSVGGGQTAAASLSSCCANFVLGGYCSKDEAGNFVGFEDIECSVDKSLDQTGKMKITRLAGEAGFSASSDGVQKACCR
ncbi:MAG: hypothetical protein ACE5J7_00215 [Candidatus Aenigmatarchaeota archaeon]